MPSDPTLNLTSFTHNPDLLWIPLTYSHFSWVPDLSNHRYVLVTNGRGKGVCRKDHGLRPFLWFLSQVIQLSMYFVSSPNCEEEHLWDSLHESLQHLQQSAFTSPCLSRAGHWLSLFRQSVVKGSPVAQGLGSCVFQIHQLFQALHWHVLCLLAL